MSQPISRLEMARIAARHNDHDSIFGFAPSTPRKNPAGTDHTVTGAAGLKSGRMAKQLWSVDASY
jgi:hypothetical protein